MDISLLFVLFKYCSYFILTTSIILYCSFLYHWSILLASSCLYSQGICFLPTPIWHNETPHKSTDRYWNKTSKPEGFIRKQKFHLQCKTLNEFLLCSVCVLVDDDGPPLSNTDVKNLVILTELPFVVSFEERVKVLMDISEKLSFQMLFWI